ncbi:MAG: Ig-like domain-containing protein, partial [Casimicrobium sp.]
SSATGHVTGIKATGGLIGTFVQGSAPALTTSFATGKVDGFARVGGLIGESTGKVTFSYATGMVTATGNDASLPTYTFAGGLIGIQDSHATEDSWASGAVSAPFSGVGGLIGSNAGPILRTTTIAGQTVSGGASAGSVGGLVGDNKGAITSSRSASTVNANGAAVESIGGLVGINAAGAGIANSYATGNVTAANAAKVGGLIGWHTTGTISGSHAQGNVTGAGNVGGLIGMSTTPAVNTSYATGSVSGTTMVGGLIGNRGSGTTDTTFATGNVTASADYAGGLIGFNSGAIKKSYANPGTVSGNDRVGGLVGNNQGSIETSYAIKTVSGINFVGGLVGQSATNSFGIRDCYAKGAVTGSDKVGGLVGRSESASNIARCYASGTVTPSGAGSIGALVGDNQAAANANNYWNMSTTALPAIGAGTMGATTGLTSVQMKQQASFVGFIFPSPWRIDEGVSEPYFDYAAVSVATSTTALASSANSSVSSQNVTFTATVTGNTPTGTVLFQEGASPLPGCIAVTVTASQAQCSISSLLLGNHSISAIYSGDVLNTGSTSNTVNQNVIAGSLDVDASITQTKYQAATDGVLIVRYLFGLTGNALVSGALGGTATRTDPVAIKSYLDSIRPSLDIDGDGTAYALTDGLLIIRHLLGLSGNALIAGAVNTQNGSRTMAPAIQSYLQSLMP